MKGFFKKAPQILLRTMTGQELSRGQKQAMRDVRGFLNDTPNTSQQELDAQRQVTEQAEAARAQAQAAQAETARLQAEAAELQVLVDAAEAKAAAAQEAKRVAELKAQLAQLQVQHQLASVAAGGAGVPADLEEKVSSQPRDQDYDLDLTMAISASEADTPNPAAQASASPKKEALQPQADDFELGVALSASTTAHPSSQEIAAMNASAFEAGIKASNSKAMDEVMRLSKKEAEDAASSAAAPSSHNQQSGDKATILAKIAKDISNMSTLQDATEVARTKDQVRAEIAKELSKNKRQLLLFRIECCMLLVWLKKLTQTRY